MPGPRRAEPSLLIPHQMPMEFLDPIAAHLIHHLLELGLENGNRVPSACLAKRGQLRKFHAARDTRTLHCQDAANMPLLCADFLALRGPAKARVWPSRHAEAWQ